MQSFSKQFNCKLPTQTQNTKKMSTTAIDINPAYEPEGITGQGFFATSLDKAVSCQFTLAIAFCNILLWN